MATVSVLGDGRMGKLHAETWAALGHDVIQVLDKENWEIMYGDIISIASPDWMHGSQVLRALHCHRHVFCEKPLCTTADQLSKIRAAKKPGQHVGVNLPLRHHQPFVELSLAQNQCGQIYMIEAEYNWGRLRNMTDWKLDPRYSIVHGGGVHMMDLLIWLTGQMPVWHAAIGNNRVCPEFPGPMTVQSIGFIQNGKASSPLVRLGVDFSFDGPHAHVLRLHGTDGACEVRNHDEVDKTVCIKLFDQALRGERPDNFDEAAMATTGCLAVEARCSRK
jgi:predicted dehydrogenase